MTNSKMIFAMQLAFLYLCARNLANAKCPCLIFVNKDGFKSGYCRGHLTTIPDCVPNNTQWLDFSDHNKIKYSPGQFQRFENLSYLNLFGNSEFAAQIDSFRFLFNLSFLNLGVTDFTNLTGETFADQSNLKLLDLRGSAGQLNVSQGLFDHLENLKHLNLGGKHVLEIPNWSFVRLRSLSVLDLSTINVLHLHNNTFSGLSALKSLDLQNPMRTMYFPNEVLKPLISLKQLHLEGLCSIRQPVFQCNTIDHMLEHVPSLEKLYIDKSLISNLGKGFLFLKNLQEMYLVNSRMFTQTCNIAQLTPERFINLRHSPLRKLVLNHCNINFVTVGWFKYLPELNEISLSITTDISKLFWSTFSLRLENIMLKTIRLSLTTNWGYGFGIPFTVVSGFNETKLTTLELTGSNFYSVNDDTITKLPKSLKYLKLTHNLIRDFGIERLTYLENLETLDLSNQGDSRVQYSTKNGCDKLEFSHQPDSKRLNFSSLFHRESNDNSRINPLQAKLHKYFNVTRTKCLSLPHRLRVLNLSKSRLLCNMVPAFCDSNNSLKILDASVQGDRSCFENQLFWSVLKYLAKLEKLNLNGNFISEIPQAAFSGLYKLRKLTLYNNKLLEISFHVNYLISLETLDLSANSIQYASNSFTGQIEDVEWKTNLSLYLNKNQLVCDCKQIDFGAWLTFTQIISNKNKLNCTFEDGTQISLGNFSRAYNTLKYKCTKIGVIIGCTVIFWGLNLILGGLAYILHNRKKLRYLVIFGRRTLNPYHPTENIEIQMEYDVYISYEGDFNVTPDKTLRDFILYTILPGLEQRGVKVIVREELDPGRNLYEVITSTVRRSKKVLAFLTNGYCQDMWNVFEFNQAVMEGIYTNRQIAIPVLFESLRRDKVKEEICAFLQMEKVHTLLNLVTEHLSTFCMREYGILENLVKYHVKSVTGRLLAFCRRAYMIPRNLVRIHLN